MWVSPFWLSIQAVDLGTVGGRPDQQLAGPLPVQRGDRPELWIPIGLQNMGELTGSCVELRWATARAYALSVFL